MNACAVELLGMSGQSSVTQYHLTAGDRKNPGDLPPGTWGFGYGLRTQFAVEPGFSETQNG